MTHLTMSWILAGQAFAGPCDVDPASTDAWLAVALEASDQLVKARSALSGATINDVVQLFDQPQGHWAPDDRFWSVGVGAAPVARGTVEGGGEGRGLVIDRQGQTLWGDVQRGSPSMALSGATASTDPQDGPSVVLLLAPAGSGRVLAKAEMLTQSASAGARLLRHRALASWPTHPNVGLLWSGAEYLPPGPARMRAGATLLEALQATLPADAVLLMASRQGEQVAFCALTRTEQASGAADAALWARFATPDTGAALAQRAACVRSTCCPRRPQRGAWGPSSCPCRATWWP